VPPKRSATASGRSASQCASVEVKSVSWVVMQAYGDGRVRGVWRNAHGGPEA
jgi:hypothetical protein